MDFFSADALPVIFAALMGLAILIYVVLDGYDLGIGVLMSRASDAEKDVMIASIGPFWDANETWLVLGVGLLLVAFPLAHGIILTALYLPAAVLLIGLILRGVSFDFRAKAHDKHKKLWNRAFMGGSLLAALAQGYMLGVYIVGFEYPWIGAAFGMLTGLCLVAGYSFVGAAWLILKTEGDLQKKAVRWARYTLWLTALGLMAVSMASPLASDRIFAKWFTLPQFFFLAPIPLVTCILIVWLDRVLHRLGQGNGGYFWAPFVGAAGLFILGFTGLAYSFFPYIIPDKMTIWQAASSPESLWVILIGVAIILPLIIAYTIYSYSVFWGKVKELRYY